MWWLLACHQQMETIVDIDRDGYADTVDCDDTDPFVFPDAHEACDGMDNNCDGVIADLELNPCPGDFDLDGNRTINDMLQILSNFGCESGCSSSMDNQDTVDTADLLLWLGVFGLDCD